MKIESRYIKPQLAKPFDSHPSTIDPNYYVAELKRDGHRRLISKSHAFSRTGKAHQHPHIQKLLPEGCMLDGELLPVDDNEPCNLVAHHLANNQLNLKFVAFDILAYEGKCVMDSQFTFRRAHLEDVMNHVNAHFQGSEGKIISGGNQYIEVSPLIFPYVFDDIQKAMDWAEDRGEEGIMLKNRFSRYKPNSRSDWMKWKTTETYDVVITDCDSKPSEWRVRPNEKDSSGVLQPEGIHTDSWNSGNVNLSYGYYDETSGNLVRVGSLGITGQREKLEREVGKVYEIKSYGKPTKRGALRHPVFIRERTDKLATDCTFKF